MEINVINVLLGLLGLLGGISLTSLVLYPKMMKNYTETTVVNAAQDQEIKSLFETCKRYDREICETREMHNKTLSLISKVVDQNNLLIGKITVNR